LFSWDRDNVISLFFVSTQDQFASRLYALAENRLDALPNLKYFIAPGANHTMAANLAIKSGDVEVGTWLKQFANDDPSWASVKPPGK
jgi:ethanolamine utilization microcompartment shell protein EutL